MNLSLIMFLSILFVFGACVGSFLNVLIYRIPKNKINIINPKRSFCPKCKTTIKFYHNIPLVSYVLLLGKCAYCKKTISPNYFIVELLSALLFVGVFLHFQTISFVSVVFLLICLNLILLSFIDFKLKAVPDYLLLSIIIFALMIGDLYNLLIFVGGAFLLDFIITFYVQNIKYAITKNKIFLNTRALGEGDMPIFGLMGAVLGIKLAMVGIFLGAILAIIPSIIAMVIKKDIHIAFIPYLSVGFIVVFFLQAHISISL